MILIGIALAIGATVQAQGWATSAGSSDGYAFNPYSMSKMPNNTDGLSGGAVLMKKVPFHIWPEDAFPVNPNGWVKVISEPGNHDAIPTYPTSQFVAPNNDPQLDVPTIRVARYILENKKPY